MSQTYVIKVSASVQESVSAEDCRKKKLVLTEIVPSDEQQEILKERLAEKGFEEVEEDGQKVWRREQGGVTETVNLEDMTVEARVEKERVLERNRTIVVRGDRDFDDVDERRQKEKSELEQAIAITSDERSRAEQSMQREIAKQLDETEEERTQELNEIVREVYAESLKRKARQMGDVKEVREGQVGEDYELVIRLTE